MFQMCFRFSDGISGFVSQETKPQALRLSKPYETVNPSFLKRSIISFLLIAPVLRI